MIDKQKLLQWIKDKRYVYEGPYEEDDTPLDIERYTGSLTILSMLQTMVDKGWLDTDEDYTPDYYDQPRFKMDEHGNLTRLEE